jgi:hypothetical protein
MLLPNTASEGVAGGVMANSVMGLSGGRSLAILQGDRRRRPTYPENQACAKKFSIKQASHGSCLDEVTLSEF